MLIYHRLQETTTGRVYRAKAALLQLDKLEVEIARLNILLLSPSKQWEIEGEVNDVVFPTGHALCGEDFYILWCR